MKRSIFALLDLRLLALLIAALLVIPGCGGGETEDTSTAPDGTADTGESTDPTPEPEPEPEVKMLPEPERPDHPRTPEGLTVKDGFLVEKLFDTDPETHGSWVAICAGPDNTVFVTAQYRQYNTTVDGKKVKKNRDTLFQIKSPAVDDHDGETEVIAHPVELAGAQGLRYAFGTLYVMESGRQNGLVRLSDTDGDGLYDSKELLLNIFGGGEHGTHAIVPTPDGEGLYLVAGNMSPLPKLDDSRVPLGFKDEYFVNGKQLGLWDEDHVLPQNPDGRGHARGLLAPGGWIVRVNPDGGDVTLVSAGYRNQYDIDVHPNGEIFAYDADMEWDLGQPWYRPTRINHAVSGSEFGWRNGSGKWPVYYEDSLPAAVDIGPGSPVGVTFGTGADFPTKYQAALYVLDWTYGTIYATHLKPDGATYTGEIEPFIMGKPLPVTDVAIADDGNMYFTAGGRRGDSALYRVSYFGVNDKAVPEVEPLTELAQLRKEIETLHTPDAPADKIDFIWDHLNHDDRFIRFAARVALEHQPIERYLGKAKSEEDAMTRIQAGLALARHRHDAAMGVLLAAEPDTELEKLAWMRSVAVAMARKATIKGNAYGERVYDAAHLALRDELLTKLNGFLPSDSLPINTEIVRLRVALNDPTVIKFALDLMNNVTTPTPPWLNLAAQNDRYGAAILKMQENPPPSVQLGIAFMLRNMTDGWTAADRTAYFSWLNRAAQSGGGNSYAKALEKIHQQALATLTDRELAELGALTELVTTKPPFPIVEPKGPGRKWTTEQATKLVDGKLSNRDFYRGAGLYQSALCSQCHVINDFGADIGPQLTTAGNKFSVEDLMRATIEPSHEISDQYAMTEIKTKDGKLVIGRLIEETDAGVVVLPDQRQPDKRVTVSLDQIASKEISKVSTMPAGLVDSMSASELRDLTAFIMSGGNKESGMFAPTEEVSAAE